jgi:hypothetical protein
MILFHDRSTIKDESNQNVHNVLSLFLYDQILFFGMYAFQDTPLCSSTV